MKTGTIMVAAEEGGRWLLLDVHSFVTPDMHRWDAVSGWGRKPYDTKPTEIAANQANDREWSNMVGR